MKQKVAAKKEVAKGKIVSKTKETSTFFFLSLTIIFIIPFILIIFWPCLKNGFSNWDDPTYLENNPLIREWNFQNIKKIFTEIYFSNYQPLHIFSYLIEYRFFKLEPFGYHLVSIIMHIGVTWTVLWFSWLLCQNKIITVITGLLFAVHPMHVESIAWAAERKDLLYSFFFFSSLIAYLFYLKNTKNKLNYFWCFLFFSLSIFSKAMAAALPPVLVLTDLYFKRKFNLNLILEKIPFFILAFIMGSISVYASSRDGSINDSSNFNFFDRIILANSNLLGYIFKLIIPLNLSGFYPYPEKISGFLPWFYYVTPAGVLILLISTFYAWKKNHIFFYGTGFFVLTLFLVLQLLPVGPTVFSERYSYIPSATFFLLIGYSMNLLWVDKKVSGSIKYLVFFAFSIYSIWLSVTTYNRCQVWENPETFWGDVIQKSERVPIAYNNRGHYYNKNGKKQEALADFNKALLLNPNYDMALFNRGSLYGEMGKMTEAFNDLNKAIELNKKLPEAYKMRGQVFAMKGQNEMALKDFMKALELQPDFPEVYFNLGIFYLNAGNKTDACLNFQKANSPYLKKAKDALEKYCK